MSNATSHNPVLLIHGIDDTVALFHRMTPYLQNRGWSVHSINLTPNNGDEGLDKLAQQVSQYVNKTFPEDNVIDLVGFSMGGIISRYYVQRLEGIRKVQRFITISSPHQGTWTAYLRPNIGGNQMRRGSLFLRNLNHDVALLERINVTSIWTPLDLMIFPAHSSRLPIGNDVRIPVAAHPLMVSDLRVLEEVAKRLSEPLKQSGKGKSGGGVKG